MEIRINLVLLSAIGLCGLSLSSGHPVAAFDPESAEIRELAFLEEAFAKEPENEMLAAHLMGRYLDLGRPGFAIAVVRTAPDLADDPKIAHRLAQAYEASDRPLDALATARFARVRCADTLLRSSETGSSELGCRASTYNALAVHERALERMVDWGVVYTSRDERVRTAYALALRRATVAIQR